MLTAEEAERLIALRVELEVTKRKLAYATAVLKASGTPLRWLEEQPESPFHEGASNDCQCSYCYTLRAVNGG